MTTQTQELLANAVIVPSDFNVVAYTPDEYFTPDDLGLRLSRPNQEDVMYLALLQKGETRIVRGNITLHRCDVQRALNRGWTVWLMRIFVNPKNIYILSDVEVVAGLAEAHAINDTLEFEGSPMQVLLLTKTGQTAQAALERYFAGE